MGPQTFETMEFFSPCLPLYKIINNYNYNWVDVHLLIP